VVKFQPEIVLLDIGMPLLDGYEVAKRLRELPEGRDVLLVAMTGWGQEEDKRRTALAGFNHHLVKPVDPVKLEKLLAEYSPKEAGERIAVE
jgi:CheY-like chemotaxis protein